MPPKKKRKTLAQSDNQVPTIQTLMTAIASDDLDLVCDIVRGGATFLNRSVDGDTPLTLATKRGNLDVIRVLVEEGKCPVINRANQKGFSKTNIKLVTILPNGGINST